MLTPEQAKALQRQRNYQSDEARRVAAIDWLPERLRPIARGLLYRDPEGTLLSTERQTERHALQARALQQLDALAPHGRTLIFAAFFPSIAEAVERGWTHLRALPYERRHLMQGHFRAPHRPDVTLEARGSWMLGLLGNVLPQDDLAWLAQHAGYIRPHGGNQLGLLFASVIDGDPVRGDEIFDILVRAARGEDEIATFSRDIPVALLAASRPDGWECVERLLLGAQREEGVRQTILEALAVAHPGAFRRILGTSLDHNLVRFSAVTRAVNGWLETTWDSDQATAVTWVVRELHTLLGDAGARSAATTSGSGEDAYLALWATACDDIYAALPLAEGLLADGDVARRYAAARLLSAAYVPEAAALLLRALDDPDARVVAQACAGLQYAKGYTDAGYTVGKDRGERLRGGAAEAFERIEALLRRLPRRSPVPAQPLLWNVPIPPLEREQVANVLLQYLGERDPKRLIPHLGMLGPAGRIGATDKLAESGLADPEARQALFDLLKDRSSWVFPRVLTILGQAPIREGEAPALEALLGRTSEELRQGVLSLVVKQPDELVLASAGRLVAAPNEQQRLAGLEALRLLHEAGRAQAECVARATEYRERRRELSPAEQTLLAPILDGAQEAPTLENALGLVRPDELTPPIVPVLRDRAWTSAAAVAALQALDALIHEHRTDTYSTPYSEGILLGENPWQFPHPNAMFPLDEDAARLPFAELWRGWAESRGEALHDDDGLELLRMLIQLDRRGADETREILAELGEPDVPRLTLQYPKILHSLCWWLIRLDPPQAPTGAADFLLDHLETVLTQIPERELRDPEEGAQRPRYREYQKLQRAVALVRTHHTFCPAEWTDAHAARLWRLLSWSVTLPQEHLRYRPYVAEALVAHRAGAASEADLVYHFLGPRPKREYGRTAFDALDTFSARKPHALLAAHPIAGDVYARCARRVLEVELGRGEMPTAATDAALNLRSLTGGETFLAVLWALEGENLARGYGYGDRERTKSYTLSHLLRATFPGAEDAPEAFGARARASGIAERRFIEAAVYAPQWARHVEHLLGWAGFAEGLWWIHAHTKDRSWAVDQAIRAEWEAEISEWTPLKSADLYDGAVDVAWFRRAFAALGERRWEALYQAAKYSSSGTGHARARLFADAMLGRVDEATLSGRIRAKRTRDAACALGLLALPESPVEREAAILARYQTLQELVRTAQSFGAQRREGDQKAARIGLENLARTAGYADPARFQWAMELQEVADLAGGPLVVTREGVALTLEVDPLGQPQLRVEKAGKPLKQVPPRLKKDPAVVALRERKQRLEQQGARMRTALEQAMCREEAFGAGELAGLLRHPLLTPMLEQLVFVGPTHMGYLVDPGSSLHTLDGDVALDGETPLRIAHPHDLYASGQWSRYQRECFVAERIQPFKQVFRELYPLTEAERRDGAISRRYAGHQLQPQQAMALLATRGWVTSPQDGSATRTFHGRGITVSVDFLLGGGTPVEVEGLTIEGVTFRAAGEASGAWGKPLPLAEVPPILFSEAMRDLDLVVSVAHRGGIDPEGSASTVEMRAALLREVCAALALANVRVQPAHAVVAGTLGEYVVHLGSGVVHRLPGGSLCIVPIHAQHRGRIFLPFADDDPKTAEIVSKVLLLARDAEIKDPLILEQLYARV